jgi:mono/diheme cytochrome c family protein
MWPDKKKHFLMSLSISGIVLISGCTDPVATVTKLLQQIHPGHEETVVRNFDTAQIERGYSIYQKNCAVCHGPNGEATPDWRKPLENGRYPPPPLDGTAHAWHHSTEELKRFILKGGPPGEGRMPGWEGVLAEQEIDDILVWVKSLWPDEVYDAWYKRIENR